MMMIMEKEDLGLEITELRLGQPGVEKNEKKRMFSEMDGDGGREDCETDENGKCETNYKSQLVGWPPVCSYRRKNNFSDKDSKMSKMYVKVSMDGAPFLRKLDLNMHKSYVDLSLSLDNLFGYFGIIGEALKDGNSCEFIPIYEDKDGDWMLVGDVPWEMFIESCKRLRIMKKSEAKGFDQLQPKGFLLKRSDENY